MINNSDFYSDFCSWTDVFLRSTHEEWRHWPLIFNFWKVYESCTVLTSFSERCFWEGCASLGQQKLWITVLQEMLKDLENVDVMVFLLVEWFRKWNKSAKCSIGRQSAPVCSLPCCATCTENKISYYYAHNISAVSSWTGNERQICHGLRTVNMIGQWKWLKWLLVA